MRISRSRGRATAHDEPRDTRCWISENERLDQPDPPRATTLWRRRERRRAGRGPSLEPAHLRLRLLAQVQAPGQALRGRARGQVRFNLSAEQETVRGARVRPVRALAALDRGPRNMLRDVPRARGADRGRDRVRRAARRSHYSTTWSPFRTRAPTQSTHSRTPGRRLGRAPPPRVAASRGERVASFRLTLTSSERRRGSRSGRGLVLCVRARRPDRVPGTHHATV